MRNWVDSAQDRDYWRALANATLKLLALTFSNLTLNISMNLAIRFIF